MALELGSVGEKVLPVVRFPLLMRSLLPGLLATIVICPLTTLRCDLLALNPKEDWPRLVWLAVALVVLGALISAVSGEIYKIYEGRILWPSRLLQSSLARQQAQLLDLLRRKDEAEKADRQEELAEVWYKLRIYPLDEDGSPKVTRPTLLGNILAGYEQYPLNRYGMDSVFYWPRLWLELDKEKKDEIDSAWSVADGFLGLSAVGMAGGALWIAAAAGAEMGIPYFHHPAGNLVASALGGAGWLLLGYIFYRLSLPYHQENGEKFKALFDLYRDKFSKMRSLQPGEYNDWTAAWAYLQYLYLRCPECQEFTPILKNDCENCGKPIARGIRDFRNSGKFPTAP